MNQTETLTNSCKTLHQNLLQNIGLLPVVGGRDPTLSVPLPLPITLPNPIGLKQTNSLTNVVANTLPSIPNFPLIKECSENTFKFSRYCQLVNDTSNFNKFDGAIIDYIFNEHFDIDMYEDELREQIEEVIPVYKNLREALKLDPAFTLAEDDTNKLYRINFDNGEIFHLNNNVSRRINEEIDLENLQTLSVGELAENLISTKEIDRSYLFVKSLITSFELSNLYSHELTGQQYFYDTNDIYNTGSIGLDGMEVRRTSDEFKSTDSYKMEQYYMDNNTRANNIPFNFSQHISKILDLFEEEGISEELVLYYIENNLEDLLFKDIQFILKLKNKELFDRDYIKQEPKFITGNMYPNAYSPKMNKWNEVNILPTIMRIKRIQHLKEVH